MDVIWVSFRSETWWVNLFDTIVLIENNVKPFSVYGYFWDANERFICLILVSMSKFYEIRSYWAFLWMFLRHLNEYVWLSFCKKRNSLNAFLSSCKGTFDTWVNLFDTYCLLFFFEKNLWRNTFSCLSLVSFYQFEMKRVLKTLVCVTAIKRILLHC